MSASTDDSRVFPVLLSMSKPGLVWPRSRNALQTLARWSLTLGLGALLPALLFALWWTACQRHWVAEQILPPPGFVFDSLHEVLQSGELLEHVRVTLSRVAWGLALGGLAGTLLGFGMALSRSFKAYVFPSFSVLSQLPVLGWIPLLIIFVGIEEPLKVSVVSISVAVPVALGCLSAISNIPRSLIEVGRVYQFDAVQLIARIVLPAAAPGLFAGVRQGVMQAWLSVVFVELLSSSDGLGFFMAYSRSLSQIDLVVVAMLAIGVLGLLIEGVLRWLESRLLSWQRSAF